MGPQLEWLCHSIDGGNGIDIFALESGDEGTVGSAAVDTISDFAVDVDGVVLDLSDMLQGEDLGSLASFSSSATTAVPAPRRFSVFCRGLARFRNR